MLQQVDAPLQKESLFMTLHKYVYCLVVYTEESFALIVWQRRRRERDDLHECATTERVNENRSQAFFALGTSVII